jgi:hypothetical protein
MGTIYTEAEIKDLVLRQINNIKGLQVQFDDATEAYDEAVRECGFPCPLSTDSDKEKKYQLLVQRMRRWFLWQLLQQYILKFQSGDARAQQIVENLERVINKLDKDFEAARSAYDTAGLLADAAYFGNDLVLTTGLIDDRIGQSAEERT